MIESVELQIDDLLLDEDNPRIGAAHTQSATLEAIIGLNVSHFRTILLSIKENGLDPGDRLYVIESEDGSDHIVLDGNRRVSALMILANPDLLDGTQLTESVKKSLRRAAEGFDRTKVEPLQCVGFASREEANEWILRRHTGAAEGEGRINWGSLEIQRFEGDRTVLDVMDFVGRNADLSDEEWQSTKDIISNRKSSTLSRLLESATGRTHLGISVNASADGKTPVLNSDPAWALKVLTKIFEDVRDGKVDTRNLNSAAEIETYFGGLALEMQPQPNYKGSPQPFRDINLKLPTNPAPAATPASKTKSKPVPPPRKTLAPKKHPFKMPTSVKAVDLLREASNLDVVRFPISSAFVLRGLVEFAVSQYMDVNNMPTQK